MVNINVSVLFSESEKNQEGSLEYSPDKKDNKLSEKAQEDHIILDNKFCRTDIINEENENEFNEDLKGEDKRILIMNDEVTLEQTDQSKIMLSMGIEKNFNKFFNQNREKFAKIDSLDGINLAKKADEPNEKIVKNIRSLHLITKKAMKTIKKHSNDIIDDKRTNFINFQTELSLINNTSSKTSSYQKSPIINIININNNYSLDNLINECNGNKLKSQFKNEFLNNTQFITKSKTPKFCEKNLFRLNKQRISNDCLHVPMDQNFSFLINGVEKESNQKNLSFKHIPSDKSNLKKLLNAYSKEKVGNNINKFIKIN